MVARLSRYAILIISISVMGVYMPRFYWKVFGTSPWKTILLYSSPYKKFVYKEMKIMHRFQYGDETGKTFDRKGFEDALPFLYWKNLDKLGKLPITINNKTYDEDLIKKSRQSFKLMPRMFPDNRPQIKIYPMFDTKKEVALPKFPKEMFRITESRMEFLIASSNIIDKHLSNIFTNALKSEGFIFPARLIAGKTTSMKPFDEGYFIVDSKNNVFHLKRVDNKPVCIRTPIPNDIKIRNIRISENNRREFYGTLLSNSGKLYIISYDNYRLIPLPLEKYNPDIMDLKMLVNPIYRVITYSNKNRVYAVATDRDYNAIARYHRDMPVINGKLIKGVYSILFPFSIQAEPDVEISRYMLFDILINDRAAMIGIIMSILLYIVYMRKKNYNIKANRFDFIIILLTGIYGLIACVVVKPEIWD